MIMQKTDYISGFEFTENHQERPSNLSLSNLALRKEKTLYAALLIVSIFAWGLSSSNITK